MRSQFRVLFVCAIALLFGACNKSWIITYDGNAGTGGTEMQETVLTPDQGDAYVFESTGTQVHVAALDTNTSGNLRVAFWPTSAPSVEDSQSCATWTAQSPGYPQQGAVLRASTDARGVTRALTVTKNIYYGATWIFNFHSWDTSKSPAYTGLHQVNLSKVFHNQPFPWHMCARVTGTRFEMKAWANTKPEPVWGDSTHGGSTTVSASWVYPGAAGWYIGHLPAGGFADFTNLKTWKYDVVPEDSTKSQAPADDQPAQSSTDRVTISAVP